MQFQHARHKLQQFFSNEVERMKKTKVCSMYSLMGLTMSLLAELRQPQVFFLTKKGQYSNYSFNLDSIELAWRMP